MILRFEELLSNSAAIEYQFIKFADCELSMPFSDFHSAERAKKAPGVDRPLDTDVADNWKNEEHKDRILYLLEELPELGDWLIEMGYENDKEWLQRYS